MIITAKNFKKLKFPLYVLPSDDWYAQDGVLFLGDSVIDEKRLPGETLGIRRLQCGRKDLLPLKKAVMTVSDLTQSKNKFFVDSNGFPFIYQKTMTCKLRTYRIKKIELKGEYSLLWLYGWATPFTLPRPPFGDPEWVRFLLIQDSPWILYDYVQGPGKDLNRRV